MKSRIDYISSFLLKCIFLASTTVIILIASETYKHTIKLKETTDWVLHTYEVNLKLEQLISYMKDAETGHRGFILTRDSVFLKPVEDAHDRVNAAFVQLKKLTSDNPAQQKNLDTLGSLVINEFSRLNFKLYDVDRTISAKMLDANLRQGKNMMDEARAKIDQMINAENELLQTRQLKYATSISLTPYFAFFLAFLSLLVFILAFVKILNDVSKLKKLNARLTQTSELLNVAEIAGKSGSWEWNTKSLELCFSDNLYRLLGLQPNSKEFSLEDFLEFVHPDDKSRVAEAFENQIKEKKGYTINHRIVLKNGSVRYVNAIALAASELEKENTLIGTINDVTDQYLVNQEFERRNEEILKANELLKIAEQVSNSGSWEWNVKTDELFFSDNLYRLMGYKPQEFKVTPEKFLDFMHPEDRSIVSDTILNQAAAKTGFNNYYRIIHKNGSIRHFNAIGRVIDDFHKNDVLVGTIIDITEQHLTQQILDTRKKEIEKMNELLKVSEQVNNCGSFEWNAKTGTGIFSDNVYRLLGVEPNAFEVTTQNFFRFVHPEDLPLITSVIADQAKKRKAFEVKFRIVRPDGAVRNFLEIGKILNEVGKEDYMIGTINDITEQEKNFKELALRNEDLLIMNAELHLTTETFKHSEEIGKICSWRWDSISDTLVLSDNYYRLIGLQPRAFESTLENFLKYVHPDDVKILVFAGELMRDQNLATTNFYRIIRADGALRYVKSIGKIVNNSEGKPILIGTILDITEQHLSDLELQNRNFQLERSNNELIAFNHVASHDLQEPLRKIQTFISRLIELEADNLSETGQKYFRRIETSTIRMRSLIDDLLAYSRTEKSEQVFEYQDLNVLLERAKRDLSYAMEEKNAIIEAQKLPKLHVIPFQLQQLFNNLIGNALKYVKAGTKPHIKIQSRRVDSDDFSALKLNENKSFYEISIVDNGLGFEQQHAENIFKPFQRLHHKEAYPGTGIGLSICKKVVENHNGFIMAVSQPEKGSTFTFYLPADNLELSSN